MRGKCSEVEPRTAGEGGRASGDTKLFRLGMKPSTGLRGYRVCGSTTKDQDGGSETIEGGKGEGEMFSTS